MSYLASILHYMVHDATRSQGVRVAHRLSRGLLIVVMVYQGQTWLSLSRREVDPSSSELKTVLDSWPYPVYEYIGPVRGNEPHTLVFNWATPAIGTFTEPVYMQTGQPKQLSFI